MEAKVDKSLIDIVNDFPSWRGNPFTLLSLIIARHTDMMREKLIAAGFPDAADLL